MSLPTKVVVGAYALSGTDQYTPIAKSTSSHNTSVNSPTISITTIYANSLVLDSPAIYGGATLSSPTCTQQWNINVGGLEPPHKITGASSSKTQATPGSVTCSWTASVGELWDDVAIEVKASSGVTGLLIPLYTNPGPTGLGSGWQDAINVKNSHPNLPMYVIINPDNGPLEVANQTSGDTNFITGIQKLQSAGIKVLGYVWTGYGSPHNSATCCPYNIPKGNITQWHNLYSNVTGVFFDGMAYQNTTAVTYYQNLTSYAKSLGMTYTVGNPGIGTLSNYVGTVDNIVIWESNAMPPISQLDTNTFSHAYDKHNFSFLSFAQSPIPSSSTINNDAGDVGLMYITDDGGITDVDQNPWDQIATYLSTLAAVLDR